MENQKASSQHATFSCRVFFAEGSEMWTKETTFEKLSEFVENCNSNRFQIAKIEINFVQKESEASK